MQPKSKKTSQPGIAAVAELAKVSAATVSRILSGGTSAIAYSEATRQRVMEAAQSLNYVPNSHARRLVRGRADHVGLVARPLSSPFFGELVDQFVRLFAEFNLRVSIDVADVGEEATMAAIRNFGGEMVDAIFVCPNNASMSYAQLPSVRCPVIGLVHKPKDANIPYVSFDIRESAKQATRHLLSLGRRRIGYVGASYEEDGRMDGYLEALREAGIAPDPALIVSDNFFQVERAHDAGEMLAELPNPPDALFVASDLNAIGVIHGLDQKGLRVPHDVAIASHDGIKIGGYYRPALTTMAVPWRAMAASCVDIVQAIYSGKSGEDLVSMSQSLQSTLIVRESSGEKLTVSEGRNLVTPKRKR